MYFPLPGPTHGATTLPFDPGDAPRRPFEKRRVGLLSHARDRLPDALPLRPFQRSSASLTDRHALEMVIVPGFVIQSSPTRFFCMRLC
ncbi:unnamed protein product [Closterium sp. Naga37s-1]|nr:unnamed protein product [Closterium sp. Naga37s-1]